MISQEELLRQAHEAEKDLAKEEIASKRSPIWMALGLGLLLVLMIIPFQYFSADKNPQNIPNLEDVQSLIPSFELNKSLKYGTNDYLKYLEPNDPIIKKVANKIVVESCKEHNQVCYAKALFYFVRDKIDYINDPVTEEYIEYPEDVLYSKSADCDGKAVLLANMLQSIGIETRFVFVPGHVFVQAFLPEALNKYKEKKSDAINLDPACKSCDFGELSREVRNADKTYI